MLELPAVIFLHLGCPDHLILIRVISGCGATWKILYSVCTSITHLIELKARIAQHIPNVTPETLWSVVKHAVSRFQHLVENSKQHTEHVLHQSREIKKPTWWMFFMLFLASGLLKTDFFHLLWYDLAVVDGFTLLTVSHTYSHVHWTV